MISFTPAADSMPLPRQMEAEVLLLTVHLLPSFNVTLSRILLILPFPVVITRIRNTNPRAPVHLQKQRWTTDPHTLTLRTRCLPCWNCCRLCPRRSSAHKHYCWLCPLRSQCRKEFSNHPNQSPYQTVTNPVGTLLAKQRCCLAPAFTDPHNVSAQQPRRSCVISLQLNTRYCQIKPISK